LLSVVLRWNMFEPWSKAVSATFRTTSISETTRASSHKLKPAREAMLDLEREERRGR
jgi:hypothetical protein